MGLLDFLWGPPGRDKFARLVMEALRKRGEVRELSYDAGRFRIAVAGGSFMNLTNGYQEYCAADKGKRGEVLKRFLSAWSAPERTRLPEAFEDVHPDLLPVVRSRFYYAAADLQGRAQGGQGMDIPQQLLGDHLCVSLVYDLPTAMRSISQDDLDHWQVTFYEALEASRRNLEQMGPTAFVAIPEKRIYISANHDNYDASRLLILDLIRRLEVRGDPVVLVPNRDTLIVTGTEEDDGLTFLASAAEKSFQEPRPISAIPLVLRDDEWQTWQPAWDSPLAPAFRALRLRSLGAEYNDQKDLLDDLHQHEQKDLFVASFKAYEQGDKQPRSFCVWVDGADSLLPETDEIHLYRPGPNQGKGNVVAVASWRQVREICGDLLEPAGLYPERYRVREFPTSGQLEQLKSNGNRSLARE
jgi:hypothetical protein